MENQEEDYPQDDSRSFGKAVSHVTLGLGDLMFPGCGYLMQKAADRIAPDPLQKRREQFLVGVGRRLRELEQKLDGFSIQALSENEEFLSTLYQATDIAMKTHREEKRAALKAAVVNSARMSLADALHGRFMSYLDTYSGMHIRTLEVMRNPGASEKIQQRARQISTGSLLGLLMAEFEDQSVPEYLLRVVVQDLSRDDLISVGSLGTTMTTQGMLAKWTTQTGDAFLTFVSEASP